MRLTETPDIYNPKVRLRLTFDDPLRKGLARTSSSGDAEGVETRTDEKPHHLGCFSKDEVAVGCERLRPVDELSDPDRLQRSHPDRSLLHMLLEMVVVGCEKFEIEPRRHTVFRPRFRVRLVTAHDKPPDLLLEVDEPVGVPQRWQTADNARDGVGHHVLVLDRHQRYVGTGHPADFSSPLTGTVHDDVCFDITKGGDNALYMPALY